jgi:flavin-binding protein dodecin
MADSVFKKVTLVGTSTKSLTEAVVNAVNKASQAEGNVSWFEVLEQRGRVNGAQIEYQVTVCVGVKL